jgi:hypothetical protein
MYQTAFVTNKACGPCYSIKPIPQTSGKSKQVAPKRREYEKNVMEFIAVL